MGFTGGPQACPSSTPALVSSRLCGLNQDVYTSNKIVLGGTWNANVACPAGDVVGIVICAAPLNRQRPNGMCLLVDLSRKLTNVPGGCPLSADFPVPLNLSLLGCSFYSQAGYFEAGSLVLTNSQDWVVGTY